LRGFPRIIVTCHKKLLPLYAIGAGQTGLQSASSVEAILAKTSGGYGYTQFTTYFNKAKKASGILATKPAAHL